MSNRNRNLIRKGAKRKRRREIRKPHLGADEEEVEAALLHLFIIYLAFIEFEPLACSRSAFIIDGYGRSRH